MKRMRLVPTLRLVLPLLAVIGLLVAPIARSALAMPAASHAQSSMAAAEDVMASMPEGMPCCPDEAPSSDCAKNCPLLAICMSPCMQSLAAIGLLIPYRLAGRIAPGNDSHLERLGQPPPGRPPKA